MPTPLQCAHAIAHLHQLARLDASGPGMIAPVLHSLRSLIGFDSSGYFHPHGDGDGELQAHMEHSSVLASVPDHFDPRIRASEAQVFHNVLQHSSDIARHPHGPQTLAHMLRVTPAALLGSDYYNVVLRPAGVGDWLCLPLVRHGRGIGMLFLFRPPGAPAFSEAEQGLLARLEPVLACALAPGPAAADAGEVLREGLLVISPAGRSLWTSPEAEGLMQLAFGWRWRATDASLPAPRAALPPALARLVQRLQDGEEAADPCLEVGNTHGCFHIRATPLAPAGPKGGTGARTGQAVALHVTQRAANGARLLKALQTLNLSARQHEMAWWLARGLPQLHIAERMGVSAHTVVYHRRQLYNRLGVMDRQELLALLGSE
jgi:DNA-binding CsgD family transcriptional regulator